MKDIYIHGKFDLDRTLCYSEASLHDSIIGLRPTDDGWGDADSWLKVAEFVASLFCRAPDFVEQQAYRFERIAGPLGPLAERASEMGRVFEFQRISAAVYRACWRFIYCPDACLVTNDRGMLFAAEASIRDGAYIVPLRRDLAVMVGGKREQKPVRWRNGRWEVQMPLDVISREKAMEFNAASFAISRWESYGATEELMSKIQSITGVNPAPPPKELLMAFSGGAFLGSTSSQMREDEMLLFKLAGGIRKPEDPENPPDLYI